LATATKWDEFVNVAVRVAIMSLPCSVVVAF